MSDRINTDILRTAHNTSLSLRHRLGLCIRAADEIDRLRAENERLREALADQMPLPPAAMKDGG